MFLILYFLHRHYNLRRRKKARRKFEWNCTAQYKSGPALANIDIQWKIIKEINQFWHSIALFDSNWQNFLQTIKQIHSKMGWPVWVYQTINKIKFNIFIIYKSCLNKMFVFVCVCVCFWGQANVLLICPWNGPYRKLISPEYGCGTI